MRVLITGAGGFIGSYLIEHLSGLKHEVWGLMPNKNALMASLEKQGRVKVLEGKVEDIAFVKSILVDEGIDTVFHLAAIRSQAPELYQINILGSWSLLESVRISGKKVRTVLMSSSAVYGEGKEGQPFDENSPLKPLTPYGVSKAAVDLMGYQVFSNTGLPVYQVRPFNIIGPRQSGAFFCPTIASQIAAIERGDQKPVLKIGNLDSYRDFLDVRDLVEGVVLVVEQGKPGETYNLCSGKSTHVKRLVDYLLSKAKADITIETKGNAPGAGDVAYQIGSYDKIKRAAAWEPKINLERSLDDILEHWRQRKVGT